MNPIDLALGLTLAVFIAIGAARGVAGLFLGVGTALLLRPLLLLSTALPVAGLAAALVGGLLLTVLSRRFAFRSAVDSPVMPRVAGGFGGAVAGALLLLSLSVSLPIGRTPSGQIEYPPSDLPVRLGEAVRDSRLFREGRDILLYPLLDRQGLIPEARRPAVRVLHDFLIVGEPWEGGGG